VTICTAALLAVALLGGCSSVAGNAASPPRATTSLESSAQAAPSTLTTAPGGATATSSAEPTTPVDGVVTIGWVGDTTPGSRYGMPPQGGRALFSKVRALLVVPDIMVGNLEGTFGNGGKSKEGTGAVFSFQAPPAYAAALPWAGFDLVNLANNHAHDFLEAGMVSTQRALKTVGVAYTGLPSQISVVESQGVRVAFVGVSPYRWSQSLADIPGTAKLVRRARQRADVVIVLMHAGAEGSDKTRTPAGAEHAYGEFRGSPRAFAHAMIDAGASAVLGSGPHVVRGIERYRGRLIAYSLGNFAGWGNFGTSGTLGLSGLLTIRVDRAGEVLGGRWLSLKLAGSGAPAVDPKGSSLTLVRKLSGQDFADPWPMAADGTLAAGR
jgi:Bacterial capsule synthesis protein PGA_cap